jgi:hypothetical protein
MRLHQQRILESKKLNHRNFGIYSKHECGYDTCHLKGLMLRQDSWFREREMHFCSDQGNYIAREKAKMQKQDRKSKRQLITERLNSE